MSPYTEFRNETLLILKNKRINVLKLSNEELTVQLEKVYSILIKRWIKEKKFDELVYWVGTNYDTNDGDKSIIKISNILIKTKNNFLVKKLWIKIIKNRREHYNAIKKYQFQSEDKDDARKGLEFAMNKYIKALTKLNENKEANNVLESLIRFQKREDKLEV